MVKGLVKGFANTMLFFMLLAGLVVVVAGLVECFGW